MKRPSTDLGTPRRMLLAVIVAIVFVLAWNLSEPWRTGIHEHRAGSGSKLGRMFHHSPRLSLGTNYLWWLYSMEGEGCLHTTYHANREWHFAACARTNLLAVTPQDARGEFVSEGLEGFKVFGNDWYTNQLVVRDGQILLIRHATDTQTVYALEVVEQRDYAARFRSRKILPAPPGQ